MRIKTILVDDESEHVKRFVQESQKKEIDLVGIFDCSQEALLYAQTHPVDCAFLDIKMPQLDGLTLGKKLREISQNMILIYISAQEEFLREAMFDVHADYFIKKPCEEKEIAEVLDRARYLSARLPKRVFIKTFGSFDLFVDGELVEFVNQKAKELLAICVDCEGGEVAMRKAIALLWEGRPYDDRVKNLYRKAILYLKGLFQQYEMENIFVHSRGNCHINRMEIQCDFYEVINGKRMKDSTFDGRYMMNYSWAEETCGRLNRMYDDEL